MEPTVIAALIAGGVALVGSIISAVSQESTNQQNIAYQQQENETLRNREDTAMQRAVSDYQAAGINPLLALPGHGAQSATVSAPSRQNVDYGSLLEAVNPTDYVNTYFEQKTKKMDLQLKEKELKQRDEELNLLKSKVEAQSIANTTADLEQDILRTNYEFYNSYGLPSNATGLPKYLAEGSELNNKLNNYLQQFGENPVERVGDFLLEPVTPLHAPLSKIAKKLWHVPFEMGRKVKNYFSPEEKYKRKLAKTKRNQRRVNDYASRYIYN